MGRPPGLWDDKALQDVSSESALTPPTAFHAAEGGARGGGGGRGVLEASDTASVTN